MSNAAQDPEAQKYQDKDWCDDEAYTPVDESCIFIPEERYLEDVYTDGDHYIVERLEVHKQPVAVRKDEASTPREAAAIVRKGGGECLPMQSDSYVKDLMDHEGSVQWRIFDSGDVNTGSSRVSASRMSVHTLD